MLHLTGYDFPIEEIKNFRQWGSQTPGHPERSLPPGVEMTTGPLGQGISSAVGMALAERMLAAQFNTPEQTVVDHRTYAFCGDGCLMEGVSHEACSLAGTWGLGKLIVLYDSNGISIDGKIDAWFSEDVGARFRAYRWQVIGPIDGHDSEALDQALAEARADLSRPSLIICHTHIGFGSPKADSAASHGSPLGESASDATRRALDWHEPPFEIPQDIYAAWDARAAGQAAEAAWNETFAAWAGPSELAAEFLRRMAGDLPADWAAITAGMLKESRGQGAKMWLPALPPRRPWNIWWAICRNWSAARRTCRFRGHPDRQVRAPQARRVPGNYISWACARFGMSTVMNGLALHGGYIPYAGTFMAFSDQAKNAVAWRPSWDCR